MLGFIQSFATYKKKLSSCIQTMQLHVYCNKVVINIPQRGYGRYFVLNVTFSRAFCRISEAARIGIIHIPLVQTPIGVNLSFMSADYMETSSVKRYYPSQSISSETHLCDSYYSTFAVTSQLLLIKRGQLKFYQLCLVRSHSFCQAARSKIF